MNIQPYLTTVFDLGDTMVIQKNFKVRVTDDHEGTKTLVIS